MEEFTLLKKIDIDLKVLSKIEHEKYPDQPNYQFKLVRIQSDEEEKEQKEQAKSNEKEMEAEVQPPTSLVQKTPVSIKKSADEFI
jgi:hypothetical protein